MHRSAPIDVTFLGPLLVAPVDVFFYGTGPRGSEQYFCPTDHRGLTSGVPGFLALFVLEYVGMTSCVPVGAPDHTDILVERA